MAKIRLDQAMVARGLAASRSQAESYIKLGYVRVNGKPAAKPHQPVGPDNKITLGLKEQYVSRAALKLASVAAKLKLDFKGKTVLDVGSSTGGFTDYALRHGAGKVVAVDVGSKQLHPSLRNDPRVELHETTDVRDFANDMKGQTFHIILIDVSFISLRQILPAVAGLCDDKTQIAAMLKPQFESNPNDVNRGVIKNNAIRRQIMKDFEAWAKQDFVVLDKADSEVAGAKGNLERFYLLKTA